MTRATITVLELKNLLGVPRATAYKWVKDGMVKSIKIGKRRLIPVEELRRLGITLDGALAGEK